MNKRFLSVTAVALLISISSIAIQSQAQTPAATMSGTPSATLTATGPATATVQPFTLLNLNTVTEQQILSIPTIINRMVREFQEYRPWVSITQYRKEIGKYVGAEQTVAWEKYLYVPVQVDVADAETLKQIPGVTDEIAKALIAARPYKTNDAFLAHLAQYLSNEQLAYAVNFLDGKVTQPIPTSAATMAATMSATVTVTSTAAATTSK